MKFRAATRPKASVAAEQTSCRHLMEVIGAERRLSSITAWDLRHYQMKRLEAAAPKTINNELLVLTAVLKSARLWAPLKETYEPLPISKHVQVRRSHRGKTSKLIETARKNDKWFVALCATVLAYATGCRSGEIKTLRVGSLFLEGGHPFIRLKAKETKSRTEREPALNELGLWAVRHLLERARLLGASEPEHYLLPADLSKHTKGSCCDPWWIVAMARHRDRSLTRETYTQTGSHRNRYLLIRRLLIFDCSVVRGIPSLRAAPDGPATRPLHSLSVASISSRS